MKQPMAIKKIPPPPKAIRKPPNKLFTKVGSKEGEIVSMIQLAKLMGVSSKTIKNWVNVGMEGDYGSGKGWVFDSAKCFRWRIEKEANDIFERFNLSPEDGVITKLEAERRTAVANSELIQLKLEKEREQVALIDDLMLNFSSALSEVRGKLVSLPSRISGLISHQEQSEIDKILEKEVQDMLEALSDYNHVYVENK